MDLLINHYDVVKAATIAAAFGVSFLGSVLLALHVNPRGSGTVQLAKVTGLVVIVFAACSLLAWGFLFIVHDQLPHAA